MKLSYDDTARTWSISFVLLLFLSLSIACVDGNEGLFKTGDDQASDSGASNGTNSENANQESEEASNVCPRSGRTFEEAAEANREDVEESFDFEPRNELCDRSWMSGELIAPDWDCTPEIPDLRVQFVDHRMTSVNGVSCELISPEGQQSNDGCGQYYQCGCCVCKLDTQDIEFYRDSDYEPEFELSCSNPGIAGWDSDCDAFSSGGYRVVASPDDLLACDTEPMGGGECDRECAALCGNVKACREGCGC